ncbi:MAG: antibiotic biosynthesis monooxygenase [Chloroflexi bacterium]|nr:antibiotic biosynthesis monooxygenase [Chloroflexota bacterium]
MYIVHVHIHVKAADIEAFRAATIENARNSRQEPGVVRFDFLQQSEDPARFTLVEVYRAPEDADKHKETAHYLTWRETVADMMAEPRVGVKYSNIHPVDAEW